MSNVWSWLSSVLVSVGNAFVWFWGDMDGGFYLLTSLVVIDFVVDVLKHMIIDRTMSGKFYLRKTIQKIMIYLVVGIANSVDNVVFNGSHTLQYMILFYYISGEALSILDHAACMGLPVPEKLQNILHHLRENAYKSDIEEAMDNGEKRPTPDRPNEICEEEHHDTQNEH